MYFFASVGCKLQPRCTIISFESHLVECSALFSKIGGAVLFPPVAKRLSKGNTSFRSFRE